MPGAPAFAVLHDTVALALATGGNPADPYLAASTLWACLHGIITLRADRPAFPWPPQADMIASLVDRMLVSLPAFPTDDRQAPGTAAARPAPGKRT